MYKQSGSRKSESVRFQRAYKLSLRDAVKHWKQIVYNHIWPSLLCVMPIWEVRVSKVRALFQWPQGDQTLQDIYRQPSRTCSADRRLNRDRLDIPWGCDSSTKSHRQPPQLPRFICRKRGTVIWLRYYILHLFTSLFPIWEIPYAPSLGKLNLDLCVQPRCLNAGLSFWQHSSRLW